MSAYEDGYRKGYEDGLQGNPSFVEEMETLLGRIIDGALPVSEPEEEWREGYEAGYEAGQGEREKQ